MSLAVNERLRSFTASLLERRGGLVDWPVAEQPGTALLPPEVASQIGARDELLPLSCESSGEGMAVNLAGDFLEWTGHLLEAEPRVGAFRVHDLYLKRKQLDEALQRAFTWLNAKVKFREDHEQTIEYHTWWFHASIASEDRWETCLDVSLNGAAGVEVAIPDPLGFWELEPCPTDTPASDTTFKQASTIARRRVLDRGTDFFARMDSRLERDRKRLRDYYQALLREGTKKKRRGQATPDPAEREARKRAVHLELSRKLGELDERYAMQVTLTPIVLVRTETPVLAVDLMVHRKQAQRVHTVYWNPLLKHFDPLACSCCGQGSFAVAFTNHDVAPLCASCSAS